MKKEWKIQRGFTLIELLVSFGILAVIFAISTISLSTVLPSTSQSTNADVLTGDIRTQQSQAMSTDASYGIHFEASSYTLFTGTSYDPAGGTNFVVNLDPTVRFANVTFPGSVIIFSPGTGDIANYTSGNDSYSFTNSQTGQVTTFKLNKYGATY